MEAKSIIKTTIGVLWDEIVESIVASKWLPLVTVIAVMSSKIGPIPTIPYIHVPFILWCLFLNLGRHWSIEKISACFLFYLPLNIIITDPAPVFQSWNRVSFFALVFLLVSPLFVSDYLQKIRRGMLRAVLFVSSIVGLGSFVCYFIGINYMKNQATGTEISDFEGSAGGFGGLTVQSIALGLYSGLSLLYFFYRSIKCHEKKKFVFWGLMGVLFLTVLISASRSAILATGAGFLVMLYQKQKENGSFIKTLLALIVGAMLTFPLWEGAAEGLIKKQDNNNQLEGKYGSRSKKWEARMEEISNSPVFGVGFSAIDPNGNDTYNKVTGTIEPGSSWFAILSMTGVIGFLLFTFLVFQPLLFLKSNPSPYNTLLLGMLSFLLVHMITEGYIYAGGNASCFVAWLIIGCAFDRMNSREDDDEVEEEETEFAL